MVALTICLVGAALLVMTSVAGSADPADGDELVRNPDLRPARGDGAPADWTPWMPEWEPARVRLRATEAGLVVDAPDKPYAVGGVTQEVRGIKGGQAYAIEALCELRRITSPAQAALIRLEFRRGSETLHPAGVLVRGPFVEGRRGTFRDVLIAPPEADNVLLSLEVRWPQGGSVNWKRVSLRPTDPPSPRKVKIGTVYLRPQNSTPERNLDLWCEQVDAAGRLGLDIVCLSEAILMVGTDAGPSQVAEPIPGPSTERLGEAARRNHLWVVAGLMEREGDTLYNTAVLLDREGNLAGAYRKVHLPREEWRKGITPGQEYPVFRTEFGTIAIQICYDWFFPEIASILALKGAEIIFAPTWGTTFADRDGMAEGETVFRVRARDNGVYLVPSVYDGSSMVIDPLGRILASNKGETGVFWAEVDLNEREPLWWVGHWGSIVRGDRMPGTYGGLVDTQGQTGPPP